jgi:Transposase IS66 family
VRARPSTVNGAARRRATALRAALDGGASAVPSGQKRGQAGACPLIRSPRSKTRSPDRLYPNNPRDQQEGHILRFSVDFRVPFSNNAAEQDVRPVKIRQKISGCLRSMAGATTFCALRSYLSTTRKHGRDALTALRELHEGQPWLPEPAPC